MDGLTKNVDPPRQAAVTGRSNSSAFFTTLQRIRSRNHDRKGIASWLQGAGCSPESRIAPSTAPTTRMGVSAKANGTDTA
jgi:hypothetical protein